MQATSSTGHRALLNIKIIDDEQADDEQADEQADEGQDEAEPAFAFAGPVAAQAYTADTAITPLQLPAGEVTYKVFGLPAGLSFAASTRTISGTPTTATGEPAEVVCMAEDSAGTIVLLSFFITVNPPLSFGDLFGLLNGDGLLHFHLVNFLN